MPLPASQICLLASQMAKGGTGMVSQAGQFLNLVLEDLKLNFNLKVLRVTQQIVAVNGTYGPFALEADYLRTYDLFFPIPTTGAAIPSGLTQFLNPVTMEQWDSEFKDPSMANYPYEYATDLSTQAQQWTGPPPGPSGIGTMTSAGQLFIYPQSTGSITLTHRYMKNQPDLVSPEIATTPATYAWFPYVDYLIIATAARMCDFTGDDRAPELAGRAMNMLRPHLIMEGDEQKTVHNIVLDPRRFHFSKGLKPTKASPY